VIRRSRKLVANSVLIGAVALLIPVTAGCEAGLNAPTLEFHQVAAGAYTQVNGISVSNLFVLGAPAGSSLPAGASASVFLSLFNGGAGDDTLVSVTSGSAASAQLTSGTVSIPVSSQVNLTGPQPSVVLTGLTKPLTAGQSIPVTLNFEHAGSVTVQVPVEPQSFYYSTYSTPPATPSATPTSTSTSTATATATPKATSTATTASATPTP